MSERHLNIAPDQDLGDDDFPRNMGQVIDEAIKDRDVKLRDWDYAILMLEGNQWLDYDRDLRRHVPLKSDPGTPRVVVNLLINLYRNIMARLSLAYPSVVVMPASPTTDDASKAKASELALQYYWQSDDIKNMLREAFQWLLTCGTVGVHSYYDSSLDKVRSVVVSPYDLLFEAETSSPLESEFVMIRTFHSRRKLEQAYPDKKEVIAKATKHEAELRGKRDAHPEDRIEVFETYWRDGRHAVNVGQSGGWLRKDREAEVSAFPVQIIRYTEIPTRLWGNSLLDGLLDLQWLYNKARTQIIANLELNGNPRALIPKTAGVSNRAFTNKPGEKVYYNPAGGKPEFLTPPSMPNYVMDNVNRIQSEMGDVSGAHSVSLGKSSQGVRSGVAIQALASKDTSQLELTQEQIERGVRDMAKVVLQLMQRWYDEPHMMRMLDVDGRPVFRALQGTDLGTEPEVFLQAGSLFRNEVQDRDQKVYDMLAAGLVTPDKALQELSWRTNFDSMGAKVRAVSEAQESIMALVQGGDVTVYGNDDLETIAAVYQEFMRTEEFDQIPPEAQQRILDLYEVVIQPYPPEEMGGPPRQVYPAMQQPGMGGPPGVLPGMGADSPGVSKSVQGVSLAEQAAVQGNTLSGVAPDMSGG